MNGNGDPLALPMSLMLVVLLVLRALTVRRFWRLPRSHGPDSFFTVPVPPGFYQGVGARALRQYRFALLAPLAIDLGIAAALIAAGRITDAIVEQGLATVISGLLFNLVAAHHAQRARAQVQGAPAAAVTQDSVEPRRLRDHSHPLVELLVGGPVLAGVALLLALPRAELPPRLVWGLGWLAYLQLGLVLLKRVFIGWRLRVPSDRAEVYLRWRAAWLRYHLRVFDAVRLTIALLMLAVGLGPHIDRSADLQRWVPLLQALQAVALIAMVIYCIRERRRLAAVERTNDPGIAINLASRGPYLWLAYFAGLVALAAVTLSR